MARDSESFSNDLRGSIAKVGIYDRTPNTSSRSGERGRLSRIGVKALIVAGYDETPRALALGVLRYQKGRRNPTAFARLPDRNSLRK